MFTSRSIFLILKMPSFALPETARGSGLTGVQRISGVEPAHRDTGGGYFLF